MSHPIYYEIKKPDDKRLCCECRKPSKVVIGNRPYCKQHAPVGVGFAVERMSAMHRVGLRRLSDGGFE